jgi:GTP cyclohydrolase I
MSALQDTQSELDDRRLPIDRVGVRSLRFPMRIRDRDAAVQHTVATVSLAVDLPHQFKGTHMSRFVEILHAHGTELTVSNIVAMPRELMKKLHADKAHVEMRFPYFRAKKAPVSGAEGLLDYGVIFEVNADAGKTDFVLTVEVPVATLCPCSKAISARGAHNQRGTVTLAVRFTEPVWIEDLIELVESVARSAHGGGRRAHGVEVVGGARCLDAHGGALAEEVMVVDLGLGVVVEVSSLVMNGCLSGREPFQDPVV